MSRAEALSVASDRLLTASQGLRQSVRILTDHDLTGHAERATVLRVQVHDLYNVVRKEADAAHRVENPGAYDETGRWIGRTGRGQ